MIRLVHISDTHMFQDDTVIPVPECDILVHSGDCLAYGTYVEAVRLYAWLGTLKAKHIVLVPGNHDFVFDSNHPRYNSVPGGVETELLIKEHSQHVHVLRGERIVLEGVTFYGVPAIPLLMRYAFWDHNEDLFVNAPTDIDVLVTHAPSYGVLDRYLSGHAVGSTYITKFIKRCPNLLLHCHGHIHEDRGVIDETHIRPLGYTASNAAICNRAYEANGPAQVFDIDLEKGVVTHVNKEDAHPRVDTRYGRDDD